LAFSYWTIKPWFHTEGKLAAIFIKPCLGVSHWPVILHHHVHANSFLAPFNTVPSKAISSSQDLNMKNMEEKTSIYLPLWTRSPG
jgi:hypothetical protein